MRLIDADKLIASIKPEESVWVGLVLAERVANAETVDAIPIEWIEKFMNRFRLGMVTSDEYALLHFMLTEWECENEKSGNSD